MKGRREKMSNSTGGGGQGSLNSAAAGIEGGYEGGMTLRYFIVALGTLAMYNAIELNVLAFLTFKRYRSLYFWSLVVAAWGIIPYALGFVLKFLEITTGRAKWLAVVLLSIGWYPMVTGQSIVLWSRLHLIVSGERGTRILTFTKWMIIVDACIFHPMTSVVTFGSNGSIHTQEFAHAYSYIEKIQMMAFL